MDAAFADLGNHNTIVVSDDPAHGDALHDAAVHDAAAQKDAALDAAVHDVAVHDKAAHYDAADVEADINADNEETADFEFDNGLAAEELAVLLLLQADTM